MTIDEIINGLKTVPDGSRLLRKSLEKLMVDELLDQGAAQDWAAAHPFGIISTSLDSARDLFKRAFPGWLYRVMECSVSDDAWVAPDFNDPQHGAALQQRFPFALRDPVEWFGTDISLAPSGRPALALCVSMLIARRKIATETITIDGAEYRKFIRYPEEVTDGTLRCISCGQIDEDAYHDDALCPALSGAQPNGKRTPVVTEAMVNAADSVLSGVRPGIPDETIRLAICAALSSSEVEG